jgi:hypothetical protein
MVRKKDTGKTETEGDSICISGMYFSTELESCYVHEYFCLLFLEWFCLTASMPTQVSKYQYFHVVKSVI